MTKRENGFGPVKSWIMTPTQLAEHERRVKEKNEGPLVRKWQRTMSLEDYLQAVREGRSRADIVLKHFNNDLSEFKKQLKDWGITQEEAVEMAQTKVETRVTKEEYLKRRMNGEKRSSILRSLGLAGPKGYEYLKEWGIREIDAEERELELMASMKPSSVVDKRVAEQIEQKAEVRGLIAINEQKKEQELADLQAALVLWKNEAERKNEYIKKLEDELTGVYEQLNSEKEKVRLTAQSGARIQELESERKLLLQTIEQAAGEDAGFIALRIPILSVAIANVERARIYAAVEALSTDVEAADIDRDRVMTELFDLLQRTVNFITADLAELHPGNDVSGFVREFFTYYNERHWQLIEDIRRVAA